MSERTPIGRLAMRHEGDFWNAYYALGDTMNGAILIGSIAMGAITKNANRKDAFLLMMRDIVSDFLTEELGHTPTWGGPVTAPEHERAGHG